MLMDEPFSGLDVQLRERLQEETLALLRETRATCLIVTHAPAEAIRLGDRIAVMRGGPAGAGGQGRGALPQPGRPVRRAAVLRDQRDPAARWRAARCARRSASLPCPGSTRATRRSCASAAAPSAWAPAGQGLPAGCCTPGSWATWRVLEIAAQGFERPLLTLVREGRCRSAGAEVVDRRRSRERAGVPRRAARGDDGELMPESLGNRLNSSA